MKEVTTEEFKKFSGAIDPLSIEVVEGAKLKLRLQEAEEQYKVARKTFMELFDKAWNEVLSERPEKYGEFAAGDGDDFHVFCRSNIVEKGFKLFIELDPSSFKNQFLSKFSWKRFIMYELDNLLKKEKCFSTPIHGNR